MYTVQSCKSKVLVRHGDVGARAAHGPSQDKDVYNNWKWPLIFVHIFAPITI